MFLPWNAASSRFRCSFLVIWQLCLLVMFSLTTGWHSCEALTAVLILLPGLSLGSKEPDDGTSTMSCDLSRDYAAGNFPLQDNRPRSEPIIVSGSNVQCLTGTHDKSMTSYKNNDKDLVCCLTSWIRTHSVFCFFFFLKLELKKYYRDLVYFLWGV